MSKKLVATIAHCVDIYEHSHGHMIEVFDLLVEPREYHGFTSLEDADAGLKWIVPELLEDWHRLPEVCPDLPCEAVLENMIQCGLGCTQTGYNYQRKTVKNYLDRLMAYVQR